LISESTVGLSVAFTRQKAGASLNWCGVFSSGLRLGGVNAPAATVSAKVMTPSGIVSCFKLPHALAEAPLSAAKTGIEQAKTASRNRRVRIVVSLAEAQLYNKKNLLALIDRSENAE
jgi:hypothetical protein